MTTAAVPLTGWAVHAVALHRRLAAAKKDPLTGLLRRDAYTARARQILRQHGDDTAVVLVDQDHFKDVNDTISHAAGEATSAYIGMTGQNPRKGVTHSRDDVAAELCDVILAAATALHQFADDPAATLDAHAARVGRRIAERATSATA